MNLLETIDDILDQENSILPKRELPEMEEFDEDIFYRLADFIINLDPELLEDDQIEEVISFIDEIEQDEISEFGSPKLARRTASTKNQASKKWYRKNRTNIKRRKAKFRRSSEGRKRLKAKERLARQGKTATGRRKVRYHVRKRSDRRDRDETLSKNR